MSMLQAFKPETAAIRLTDGPDSGDGTDLFLDLQWQGASCDPILRNDGEKPVRVREVVLFQGEFPCPAETPLQGESYNMLSQYAGTLASPTDIGDYQSDMRHYRMPQTPGFFTLYNMLLLQPEAAPCLLAGFTSSRRFRGEIRLAGVRFEIVLVLEDRMVPPGATLSLESFSVREGADPESLLAQLASDINRHHPRLPFEGPLTGWCSWYSYGPHVTDRIILDNLAAIRQNLPALRYVQIDDGYQPAMGDWLQPNPVLGGSIAALCHDIMYSGFKPAIWVAPFIAEEKSELLCQHPEWFVQSDRGEPLRSDLVTFGGWRQGPWYMLDGTHPGAQAYLTRVFRTMRQEWGCHYFKLDAIMWGAIPAGIRHDPQATSIEAYRMGMRAILEGAGEGAFVLGCNAPMWPSLGLVHGMRIGNDIVRNWRSISSVSRQCLLRGWQHGRLWINDPDVIVLESLPEEQLAADGTAVAADCATSDEFRFHIATILASGGMVLSGDRMPTLQESSWRTLGKLLSARRPAAVFSDSRLRTGFCEVNGTPVLIGLNWDDEETALSWNLPGSWMVEDFLSGAPMGGFQHTFGPVTVPPHGAVMYRLRRAILPCDRNHTHQNEVEAKA